MWLVVAPTFLQASGFFICTFVSDKVDGVWYTKFPRIRIRMMYECVCVCGRREYTFDIKRHTIVSTIDMPPHMCTL